MLIQNVAKKLEQLNAEPVVEVKHRLKDEYQIWLKGVIGGKYRVHAMRWIPAATPEEAISVFPHGHVDFVSVREVDENGYEVLTAPRYQVTLIKQLDNFAVLTGARK